MTTGNTYTGSLSDSLPTIISASRITSEYEGIVSQLVERQRLGEGIGNTWNEITLGQLTAQNVSESEELDNPQLISDTNFAVTPTIVGIQTVLTDKVRHRIDKKVYAKIGQLAQNAIQRKKDQDGIVVFDGGTSLSGAGTTLTSGIISAAKARIAGNSTEGAKGPYRAVLHQYQLKDLADELTGGVGSVPLPDGPSATVFREGFKMPISNVEVYEDNNITIDSSSDAKGGVFAKQGIVLVEGRPAWAETKREPQLGGGADSIFHWDEYAYAERLAAATTSAWLFEVYSDATVPTG